jgi:hypothetical protein
MDTIGAAVVELARYALLAYVAKLSRDVIVHWIDHGPVLTKPALEAQIVDTARAAGIDLHQLAERVAE